MRLILWYVQFTCEGYERRLIELTIQKNEKILIYLKKKFKSKYYNSNLRIVCLIFSQAHNLASILQF